MSGPFVFSMPGASLMRIALLDGGRVRVECPGCGAVETYRPRRGRVEHKPFRHAIDDCQILQRIDRALLASREAGGTH